MEPSMTSDPRRNLLSVVIFRIFILSGAAALGAGAAREHAGLDSATRAYLSELHVSLGLTAAIFLAAQMLLGTLLYLTVESEEPRKGRRAAAFWLRQAIYLLFAATAAAGALAAAFRGEQLFFSDYALPFWDAGDPALAERLQALHGYAAYALVAAVAIYAGLALFDRLSPIAASEPRKALEMSAPPNAAAMIADGLAQSFRFFGATAFWIQLFLGVVSALLLVFGFVGHTVSPGGSSFSDAIYWASAGLALLLITTLFGFRYMSAAARVRIHPDHYLAHQRRMAFWFVSAGGFVNVLGALVSFVGVGLSVALLVGKTVSQPPGIAITDPNKIIRALDVFVLLVNFSLLFAHFIGFGVAAWLSISALRARHQYLVATEAGK
jgi:cytochrome b561